MQARLEELGEICRIQVIRTTGDNVQDVALSKVGTKGLFTKEIEEALLDGSIDLAVHSLKDMPTDLPDGLMLAAIPEREDARDALVGCTLSELRVGARVGTSSLRRSAQLLAVRPDVHVENIRGNVDTRLRKLDEGQYDAILLASAGLRRLGWSARISDLLDPETMCPAVGQGALAIQTRDDGGHAQQVCAKLNHLESRVAVTAERAVLASLGGGCQVPIGALAQGMMPVQLRALIITPDGRTLIRGSVETVPERAEEAGRELGESLLARGGRAILDQVYSPQL
ncbi:MAG: hydroxymethylbilane synthase [Acidobacteriota bacterium]|nr:hydroxymethylbilane synthase [Acidobacteriota bacterium]